MIQTENLTRYYGSLAAVQDLNLTLEQGELFGFLGPNGAGKTTTIRMVVGLLRPTSGTVSVAGHDVGQEPLAVKRALGYLAQTPILYERLTGREFLRFLVSPAEIIHMTNANGAVPARKSAIAQSELYAEGGPLNVFVQQLEGGVALERPVTPAYPVITSSFSDVIQNIVAGADVQEELDKAVKKIDQDIEDNQGYPLPE